MNDVTAAHVGRYRLDSHGDHHRVRDIDTPTCVDAASGSSLVFTRKADSLVVQWRRADLRLVRKP